MTQTDQNKQESGQTNELGSTGVQKIRTLIEGFDDISHGDCRLVEPP